jgi:hypothetical protein
VQATKVTVREIGAVGVATVLHHTATQMPFICTAEALVPDCGLKQKLKFGVLPVPAAVEGYMG